MMKQIRKDFNQVALMAIMWLTVVTTLTRGEALATWRLISLGVLIGVVFGVIYSYLWRYSTFGAPWNVLISTISNIGFQILALRLYSTTLFDVVSPYLLGTSLLTFVMHVIIFYYYTRYQNKRLVNELNQNRK